MRTSRLFLQAKKQTQASFMAAAGKVGNEEKWAQAAMEYIYEKNHVMDPRKRQADIEHETRMSFAYDRYVAVADAAFESRMTALCRRMTEALEAIPSDELLEEALLLNSQQPPLNYRRPSLTPPIHGYEPGFGFDVPQLRNQSMEYPKLFRPTDAMEFQGGGSSDGSSTAAYDFDADGDGSANAAGFPFVGVGDVRDLTTASATALEEQHGEIREAVPLTGVEGEEWEAYTALHKRALARQKLILDLADDAEMKERYDSDETFRQEELQKRGIVALEREEEEMNAGAQGGKEQRERLQVERHWAQDPTYQPIRK